MVSPPPHGSGPQRRLSCVHLVHGLLVRNNRVLLVASRYPNHDTPLWNLPGGRTQGSELFSQTLVREFFEETGLNVRVGELLFISESYDGSTHFNSTTFSVQADGDASPEFRDAHVVAVEWVPLDEVEERMTVKVVREPLCSFLRGERRRYYGYAEAGISIEFAD